MDGWMFLVLNYFLAVLTISMSWSCSLLLFGIAGVCMCVSSVKCFATQSMAFCALCMTFGHAQSSKPNSWLCCFAEW